MIDLIIWPLLAGISISIACGPLGCFVVWRRMAYFGDAIAHGALMGVALGILLNINLNLSIVFIALVSAALLTLTQKKQTLSNDTLLGIISHGSLAFGLLIISVQSETRVDMMSLLMGDILTVTLTDVLMISFWSACVIIALILFWRRFLLTSIDSDMAQVENHNITLINLGLMSLVAITIGIAIKVVGVLLIAALLIVPASCARIISKSPEAMAFLATSFSILSVATGLVASFYLDLATGPSIVTAAISFYTILAIKAAFSKHTN